MSRASWARQCLALMPISLVKVNNNISSYNNKNNKSGVDMFNNVRTEHVASSYEVKKTNQNDGFFANSNSSNKTVNVLGEISIDIL